jgi:hypothetical protein
MRFRLVFFIFPMLVGSGDDCLPLPLPSCRDQGLTIHVRDAVDRPVKGFRGTLQVDDEIIELACPGEFTMGRCRAGRVETDLLPRSITVVLVSEDGYLHGALDAQPRYVTEEVPYGCGAECTSGSLRVILQ